MSRILTPLILMQRNLRLLIALVVVATLAAYVVFVVVPTRVAEQSYKGAKSIAEDIRKAFQFTPEVRVHNTIVLNQQTPVLELAVLSQLFEHRYIWENSWLGSTKKIYITGSFRARAGFDLREKFSITLRGNTAWVSLPSPRTLSVESLGDITYRDEQGIWNWVRTEDRTRATNAFIRDARRYADQADFVQDARRQMESQLKELLHPYAEEIVVEYRTAVSGERRRR